MQAFSVNIDQGIAELVFDHPPVNAFNSQGWADIARTLEELGRNDKVRVIVIRAEGRGFCAGVDIKELAADANLIVAVNKGNYDTFKAIHRNPLPVIVAVHGFVLGGGIGICGAADILVAADCARFGVPEVDPWRHGWRRAPAAFVPGAEGAPHVLHRRHDRRRRGLPTGRRGARGAA